MPSRYSDEARYAARELRVRLKRDLAEGRFVSSATAVRHPNTTKTESQGASETAVTRKG